MVQLSAAPDYISSLAEAERVYGVSRSDRPEQFFPEWIEPTNSLSVAERERLDLVKGRYLYHRQHGHLLENAVNFLIISPLLELAGFYDPPFLLRSEASVRFKFEDETRKVYQGRIDALVVKENLWVVLVESKRISSNMTTALPQVLAYMALSSQESPRYGLVSNGEYSIFLKLHEGEYALSDDFSLNRRRNELWDVLQILNQLEQMA